jgi:hypothetical protein
MEANNPDGGRAIVARLRERGYSGEPEIAHSLGDGSYTVVLRGSDASIGPEALGAELSELVGRPVTVICKD